MKFAVNRNRSIVATKVQEENSGGFLTGQIRSGSFASGRAWERHNRDRSRMQGPAQCNMRGKRKPHLQVQLGVWFGNTRGFPFHFCYFLVKCELDLSSAGSTLMCERRR